VERNSEQSFYHSGPHLEIYRQNTQPMQLESSGLRFDRLVRESYCFFSFGRRGILHTIWKWVRLLKEESDRKKHKCTKRGRNYTMTCTTFNLTPLQYHLETKDTGARTHRMHMKKGKNIQKKLKLIFTGMQWKPFF